MEFKSVKEVKIYLKELQFLGMGSQGSCYYRPNNNDVLKIFNDYNFKNYVPDKSKQEILRFSHIKNKTFIWPTDIITLNGIIIGYISPYVKAKNLYEIDPLSVNLNTFTHSITKVHKDLEIISQKGILTYDMMYNILFNRNFYIIDEDEYAISDLDISKIKAKNNRNFDFEIYYFLIDNYFNNIINDDRVLADLYKNKQEDALLFINLFRKKLSELVEKEIVYLKDAQKYMDHSNNHHTEKYIRKLF